MLADTITRDAAPGWKGLPTYGTGQYGAQFSPAITTRLLPENAPPTPPKMLVAPAMSIVQSYAPAGLRLPATLDRNTTFQISPVREGLLYVAGVKSLNEPNEVDVIRIEADQGTDAARNAAPFDAAAFSTFGCFCPVDWGCGTSITITIRGLVPGAVLNWILFGTFVRSWNSCYPSAATIEKLAAAYWATTEGLDPYGEDVVEQWKAKSHGGRPSNVTRRRPRAPTRIWWGKRKAEHVAGLEPATSRVETWHSSS